MAFSNGQDSLAGRSKKSRHLLPVVFFLVLTAISVLLHIEKNHRQKEMLAAKAQSASVTRDQRVEHVKNQRSRYYKIQYYLGYPAATSYAVADFIRRLSAAIPLHEVRELQIDPGLQNFSFWLTIGISAGSAKNVQMTAADYLDQIGKFPEVMRVKLAKVDPVLGSAGGNRVRFLSFSGQAEMQ